MTVVTVATPGGVTDPTCDDFHFGGNVWTRTDATSLGGRRILSPTDFSWTYRTTPRLTTFHSLGVKETDL